MSASAKLVRRYGHRVDGPTQGDPAWRRVIDVAIGIVRGLRGCSERAAFDDLGAADPKPHRYRDRAVCGRFLVGAGRTSRAELRAIGGWGHLMADRMSFVDQHG